MRIAVDFDGTLSITDKYNQNNEFPRLDVINQCKKAKEAGNFLILWTCRGGIWLEEAIKFCKQYNLEFDTINKNIPNFVYYNISNKVVADLYVDDKSPGSIEYFLKMNFRKEK